jgi:hypothetical protein
LVPMWFWDDPDGPIGTARFSPGVGSLGDGRCGEECLGGLTETRNLTGRWSEPLPTPIISSVKVSVVKTWGEHKRRS